MPNWCNNYLKLEGPAGLIDRAKRAIERDELCNEFFSIPADLKDTVAPNRLSADRLIEMYGYADWYAFCVAEWGTKWDISYGTIVEEGEGYLIATFDTAWSPPIALIEKLEGHGFTDVCIDYVEYGMNFVGQWNNGYDECYEIDEDIPEHMDELWGISEMLAEREEFDEEETN